MGRVTSSICLLVLVVGTGCSGSGKYGRYFEDVFEAAMRVRSAVGQVSNLPSSRINEDIADFRTAVDIARSRAASPDEQALAEAYSRVQARYELGLSMRRLGSSDRSMFLSADQLLDRVNAVYLGKSRESPDELLR